MEKIALITGASRGIGREFAHVFAKNGYSLILIARNHTDLEQLQEELSNKYGGSVKILSIDLLDPNGINIILDTFANEMPKLDVLVNNAGIGLAIKFTDMSQEELNNMLRINVTVLTQLTYKILPFMLRKKSGKILNVASTVSFMPGPFMSLYYASKAYVLLLTRSLYDEYKRDGIIISALCPGLTRTGFLHHAKMDQTRIISGNLPMMAADKVAMIGFKGLMKNKRIIIPGFMNKVSIFLAWLFPTFIVSKVTAALQKPRG